MYAVQCISWRWEVCVRASISKLVSGSSISTTLILPDIFLLVVLQTLVKWFGLEHVEHIFPNAGQSSFFLGCKRPQYMQDLSFWSEECRTTRTSACSATCVLCGCCVICVVCTSAVSWIWHIWIALWRVSSLSFSSCLLNASDDTPHTIRSRMSESFRGPYSQLLDRILSDVIKFCTGSDGCWTLLLNLCRSMMTLVSGLQSSVNLALSTVRFSRLSAGWTTSPAFSFKVLPVLSNISFKWQGFWFAQCFHVDLIRARTTEPQTGHCCFDDATMRVAGLNGLYRSTLKLNWATAVSSGNLSKISLSPIWMIEKVGKRKLEGTRHFWHHVEHSTSPSCRQETLNTNFGLLLH